jgi:preprotein translocase subunit Sec63
MDGDPDSDPINSGEDGEEGEAIDNEYYSFLNLSREASESEIGAAYKKFSLLYHPDKHVDPVKKAQAEILFDKLKKAYDGEPYFSDDLSMLTI